MNAVKLANIQKTAVSRVFGSFIDSVSCVVLEDSFGCLWKNSCRWLAPSMQTSSSQPSMATTTTTPSFPSYLSPLQDLLLALERSTKSKVLSVLSAPISPSLPTHHPTRKVFESLTSPFVSSLSSTGPSTSIGAGGGDAFPSPHRTHVLSSSQPYKLSGPSSSSSSSSQHLPFLFYSSPASTQESIRALLCSLVNGCTTDLLNHHHHPPSSSSANHTNSTNLNATSIGDAASSTDVRCRRVKMLILGDGDGDQCLTLSEWESHMKRVSEIVSDTFGAGRRRKSTTTNTSDSSNVHHAPTNNNNNSEARSTPYYPTSLELLVASV